MLPTPCPRIRKFRTSVDNRKMEQPRWSGEARPEVKLELLEALLEEASDVLILVNEAGTIQQVLGAVGDLAADPDELVGRALAGVVDRDDAANVRRLLERVVRRSGGRDATEVRMRFRDASLRPVELLARNQLQRPAVGAIVIVARDVSERKAREDQLRYSALHDPMTGLPNRTLFADRLTQALLRRRRSNASVAVLFVDIDDFKAVNDRLGHRGGDELMIALAGRLSSSLRGYDTAARLGGDEFGALLDQADEADAIQVARRILAALDPPFVVEGESLEVRASIGIAVSLHPSDTGSELLRRADLAMYAAKMGAGNRYEIFEAQTERALRAAEGTDAREREADPINVVRLERAQHERAEIRAVLDDPAGVATVFQPIVELETGRVAGYEALARFPGLLRDPRAVFAQAHRCGLGSFLEANAIAAALNAAGRPADTFLALNLSPTALMSRETAKVLPASLDDIVVEITEQELAPRSGQILDALAFVRGRGARIALDDAGAGYNGLKHLADFSPDMIKIDQELIRGAHADLHKGALVASLVNYARRIGASTCAEGVEEHAELEFARAAGVDFVQGFLVAAPAGPWLVPDVSITNQIAHTGGPRSAGPAGSPRERLGAVLARAKHWHEVDQVLGLVAVMLAVEEVYLSRFDPEGEYVTLVAAHGRAEYDIPYPLSEYPTTAEVVRELRPRRVSTSDPGADPHEIELLLNEGMTNGLLYPVTNDGECIGLLEIYARREREWTSQEERYLSYVADRLGEAMPRLGLRPGRPARGRPDT
jgi:diguanylate cyclase (GGDEF)-like protein/PAS domain S-box-containing protein